MCLPMCLNTYVPSVLLKHHLFFFFFFETYILWCVEAFVPSEVFKDVFLLCLNLFVTCVVFNDTY
jgi:hypothetical protein